MTELINIHKDVSQVNDFNQIARANSFKIAELDPEFEAENEAEIRTFLTPEIQDPEPINQGMIADILRPTFDILAPNWQITDDEINQLAQSYEAVADKYNLGEYLNYPEFNAVLITGIIMYKRIGIDPKNSQEEQDQSQRQEQQTFKSLKKTEQSENAS